MSERRTLAQFAARYSRWSILQRQAVGPVIYVSSALLNPVLLAAAAVAVERTPAALAGFAAACAMKTALDGAAARVLRPAFRLRQLALVPLKDLVFGAVWAYGLVCREVDWRGTRLRVRRGTRIELPAPGPALEGIEKAASA